jgi:hypothetical protein
MIDKNSIINFNYNNHDFVSYKKSYCIFICKKCDNLFKIEVQNFYDRFKNFQQSAYYNKLNLKWGMFGSGDDNSLKCEDLIIKDIIE